MKGVTFQTLTWPGISPDNRMHPPLSNREQQSKTAKPNRTRWTDRYGSAGGRRVS
jgi:hypothetical protein